MSVRPSGKWKTSSTGLLAGAVAQRVADAGHQEGGVPQLGADGVVVERGAGLEVAGVVPVADRGAGALAALCRADDLQPGAGGERRVRAVAVEDAGHAVPEGHGVDLAAAADGDVEAAGEGVDRGGADAVQAAGGLVAGAAELAARVQPGEHQLDAGDAGAGVHVGGDAPPVVVDLHRAVGVQDHLDLRGVTGDPLVGGVVEDLVDEVAHATAVGGADVHAGPLADGVQPLKVGEVVGPVKGLRLCGQLVVLPGLGDVVPSPSVVGPAWRAAASLAVRPDRRCGHPYGTPHEIAAGGPAAGQRRGVRPYARRRPLATHG